MTKKRKIIPFIIIFVSGFVFASLIFGLSTSSSVKTDMAVAQYSNSALGAASYDSGYREAIYDDAILETAREEESAAVMVTSSTNAANSEYGDPELEVTNDTASRKLIKTYNLSYETENFDEAKAQLEQLMSLTGAYAESSDLSVSTWNNDYRNYYLMIRVPSDKAEAFLNQSSSFGPLKNRSEQVEDVTLDYVDVEAHKESLLLEYDRVIELLEEAEDLEQILLLESKLSDLRYQLESYESKLRTYDNLIDYTTIYLSIQEVHREQPKTFGERITTGFSESVENLKDTFVNLIVFVVSNSLAIVLVIVILWLVIVVVRKFIKRGRKNKIEIIDKNDESEVK